MYSELNCSTPGMRHRDVVLGVAEPKEKGLQSLHLLPFGCYIFFPVVLMPSGVQANPLDGGRAPKG